MNIKEQILDFFKDVSFVDKTHTYIYKGEKLPISVSGIVGTLYDTSSEDLASKYAKKHGVNKDLVLKEWGRISKEATDYGTEVHKLGEDLGPLPDKEIFEFDLRLLEHSPKKVGVFNFERFIRASGFKPLLEELEMVYLDEKGNPIFGGMFDRLFIKNKTLLIVDYKTNKELKGYHFNTELFPPFNFLHCNDYGKYVVQQNLYVKMLQQVPALKDYTFLQPNLVWLTPFVHQCFKIEEVSLYPLKTDQLIKQYISQTNAEEWYL